MATTGKLAVWRGHGKALTVEEFPLPKVEPDAILVKISLANICGSDMHIWRGDADPGSVGPRGTSFGHEMTGTVHELGRNISTDSLGERLRQGDQLVFPYFYPCRRCRVCLAGDLAPCPNKGHLVCAPLDHPPYFTGAFAEYCYLKPGHFAYKVPPGLAPEVVASINCAFSQVTFGMEKINLRMGESVVIQGAGGLGVYAAAVAREHGAGPVIVIDAIRERLELARAFGAHYTIDMKEHTDHRARIGRVKELTHGLGADVAVEVVGTPAAFNEGIGMVRPGGRYLEIGNIGPQAVSFVPTRLTHASKTVYGVGTYDPRIMPKVLEMIARTKDKYPYDRATSHKFRLEQVNEALQQSEWVKPEQGGTRITRAGIVP